MFSWVPPPPFPKRYLVSGHVSYINGVEMPNTWKQVPQKVEYFFKNNYPYIIYGFYIRRVGFNPLYASRWSWNHRTRGIVYLFVGRDGGGGRFLFLRVTSSPLPPSSLSVPHVSLSSLEIQLADKWITLPWWKASKANAHCWMEILCSQPGAAGEDASALISSALEHRANAPFASQTGRDPSLWHLSLRQS